MNRMSGLLLKKGIEKGLTPYELCSMYIHQELKEESPSILEKIVQQCVMKMKVLESVKRTSLDLSSSTGTGMTRCSTVNTIKSPSGESLTRILSTQSLSSVIYSEEPYRFPQVGSFIE